MMIYETCLSERAQDHSMNAAVILSKREHSGETSAEEFELPLFDFSTIVIATDSFADANKLGKGGFGCVYKVSRSVLVVSEVMRNQVENIILNSLRCDNRELLMVIKK